MIAQRYFRLRGVPGPWGWKSLGKQSGQRRNRPRLEVLEGRCLLTSIADFSTPTPISAPTEITLGPDGNLWFTEGGAGKIAEINSSTDAISEFTVDTSGSAEAVYGITTGPDGNLWFTDSGTNSIGMINPTTDAVAEFPIPTAKSFPSGITSGPGGNLWFAEQQGGGKIGEISPSTHTITEFTDPVPGSIPSEITVGPGGDLYFTEVGTNSIGSFDPTTHAFSQFVIPVSQTLPYDITTGSDGNLWFTTEHYNQIEMLDPTTDTFTPFTIPTANSDPTDIAEGSDGNLYFTEYNTNQIGMINPTTHDISEFSVPTANSQPWGVTAGPNGSLWFTEKSASKVGVNSANHLVVTSQPTGPVTAGIGFNVTISDVDGSGTVDQSYSGEATVSLANDPDGAILHGTVTADFSQGVATFTGLTLDKADSGYAIQAVTAGVLPQSTNSFAVSPTAATKLVITSQPPGTVSPGSNFGLTVEVNDEFGNLVTAYSGTVTVAPANNPGGSSLSGTTQVAVSSASSNPGYATFVDLSLNNPGSGYTLLLSASGVTTTVTTSGVNVVSSVQPPVVPPSPAIVGASVVSTQKRNKKGKVVGKPVISGYLITFGTAMNQGSLGNSANYAVDTVVITKRTKKKPSESLREPTRFSVTAVSSNSVTLTPFGTPFSKKAGMITLEASSPGIESAAGGFLGTDVSFNIAKGGKAISES